MLWIIQQDAGQLVLLPTRTFTNSYLNFSYLIFSKATPTLYLWSTRRIRGLLVYMIYSLRTRSHFQKKELVTNSMKKVRVDYARVGKSTVLTITRSFHVFGRVHAISTLPIFHRVGYHCLHELLSFERKPVLGVSAHITALRKHAHAIYCDISWL